jgi:hypothetical protein
MNIGYLVLLGLELVKLAYEHRLACVVSARVS